MSVKPNQLSVPFTQADADLLATITPGAAPQPAIATQAEAVAGADNSKMMTALRVLQSIQVNAPGGGGISNAIQNTYTNNSGSTIPALSLVAQDNTGSLIAVNPSIESNVLEILGVILTATATGSTGLVALEGFLQNVTTSFSIGDIIYLSKIGGYVNVAPEIGVNSFVAGDFIVRVGKITLNSAVPGQKDFKIEIRLIGQL